MDKLSDLKFKGFTTALLFCTLLLSACSQNSQIKPVNISHKDNPIPKESSSGPMQHFAKTEFDRLADIEVKQNSQSLQTIMLKLYKRNPKEIKKSNITSPEKMIDYIFNRSAEHHYNFKVLNNRQSADAIFLAFNPTYQGDRVFAFIIGLHTMLLKAHGGTDDFYITDSVNPQYIYNAARNIEISVWKLSNAKDAAGNLYLISNSLSTKERNISIEREFGKMIGRTDLFAIAASEKYERTITRVLQNLASALFLPI